MMQNIKKTHKLDTPVLFLVFNRPDTTKQVFQAIRKAEPSRLYVAADGARSDREGEKETVQTVRDLVLAGVDWPCEVKTLFREKNLGCKHAVGAALSWFFEQEEMGIILEDDCLPSESFFRFCQELLLHYADDTRVGMISGRNNLDEPPDLEYSYRFATGGSIWGWATWRRVAKNFSVGHPILSDPKLYNYLFSFTHDRIESGFILKNIKNVINGKLSSWAIPWGAFLKVNSQLSVVATKNLVCNIGYGADATHTRSYDTIFGNVAVNDVRFPLKHPPVIVADMRFSIRQARVHTGSLLRYTLRRVPFVKAIHDSVVQVARGSKK